MAKSLLRHTALFSGNTFLSRILGFVRDMVFDQEGNLWMVGYGGAAKLNSSRSTHTKYTTDDGLAWNDVWSVAVAPDGAVWFGTMRHGASRFDGEGWTTFTTQDGLLDDSVRCIGVGPDGAGQVAAAIDGWRTSHGDELWRVSARVEALSDLDYGVFVNDIKDVVEPVLAAYRQHYGVRGVDAVYTGLVPLVYKTQRELMTGLVHSLMWAFALIAVRSGGMNNRWGVGRVLSSAITSTLCRFLTRS